MSVPLMVAWSVDRTEWNSWQRFLPRVHLSDNAKVMKWVDVMAGGMDALLADWMDGAMVGCFFVVIDREWEAPLEHSMGDLRAGSMVAWLVESTEIAMAVKWAVLLAVVMVVGMGDVRVDELVALLVVM